MSADVIRKTLVFSIDNILTDTSLTGTHYRGVSATEAMSPRLAASPTNCRVASWCKMTSHTDYLRPLTSYGEHITRRHECDDVRVTSPVSTTGSSGNTMMSITKIILILQFHHLPNRVLKLYYHAGVSHASCKT